MNSGANFSVLMDHPDVLVLQDIGPWDQYKTITNAAERVIKVCAIMGLENRRLFYYDSDGELTELLHDGEGRFIDFKRAHPSQLEGV